MPNILGSTLEVFSSMVTPPTNIRKTPSSEEVPKVFTVESIFLEAIKQFIPLHFDTKHQEKLLSPKDEESLPIRHSRSPSKSSNQPPRKLSKYFNDSGAGGRKRAILIGAHDDDENRTLNRQIYKEIEELNTFLQVYIEIQKDDILIFSDEPGESPERLPTRENIMEAVLKFVKNGVDGKFHKIIISLLTSFLLGDSLFFYFHAQTSKGTTLKHTFQFVKEASKTVQK
jgi:hypothetical protein